VTAPRFSGMNGTIVDVPVGGSFEFGYHIMDRDTGRCRDSDDNGCNDLICEAFSSIYEDTTYGELDRVHEGALTSDDGRCRVTYQWGPALDSPVGTGVEGGEPLPWLSMTNFYVNAASGEVEIELRNTGTATWPWKDLVIELQTRSGDSIGFYTWTEFVLETGQNVTLTHPDMYLEEPFDACVVIDPFNDVPEGPERTGAMFHNPICPQLPDLIITDAYYDVAGGGRVRVTVQNTGSGPLVNRTVGFETRLPNGTPLYFGGSYSGVNFAPGDIRTFDLSGVSESIRERMAAGYVVTVNPEESILEEHGDNNSFVIGEATRLWIYWLWIDVPYDVRNTVEFGFDAYILTGEDRTQVADWNIRQEVRMKPAGLISMEMKCWRYPSEWIIRAHCEDPMPSAIFLEPPPGEVVILGTETVVIMAPGIMEDTVGYLIILMGKICLLSLISAGKILRNRMDIRSILVE